MSQKLACLTVDFEEDYGSRTGQFCTLEETDKLDALHACFSRNEVPVSAFVVTSTLDKYPKACGTLKRLCCDFHSHSHLHDTHKKRRDKDDLLQSKAALKQYLGAESVGYRAPKGVLLDGEIDQVKDLGFLFSSSVFPSYRPGEFNNLAAPTRPFRHPNGLLELPFAVVNGVRYVISISYLKLLGVNLNKALYKTFGIPDVLVIDSHLHDFITPTSFSDLPAPARAAFGIGKTRGMIALAFLIKYLKDQGYRFITMSALYQEYNGRT